MVEQKPTVDQRHVDQRIVDQRIAETLQSFPRVRAKQDFTAGVLERLQTAPKASRWTFTRGWLPLLAAAVLTVAVVWQTQRVDKERQRLASQARIEALRGERQALEAELDTLRRLASGSRPVLYLGAAGSFGETGVHTTTLLGSRDVTAHLVQMLPPEFAVVDFGHGDLFQADDAETLVWEPLLTWLAAH